MTINRVKLGCAVTFMINVGSVACLRFLAKALIWNKITFKAPNSLTFAELMVNELMKSIYQRNLPILRFLIELSLLNVKISPACN